MEEDDEPGGDEESFTEMDGALPHYPSGRLKPQFVVPAPQRLVLERQLNKSILIGWLPPDVVLGSLESYQVSRKLADLKCQNLHQTTVCIALKRNEFLKHTVLRRLVCVQFSCRASQSAFFFIRSIPTVR